MKKTLPMVLGVLAAVVLAGVLAGLGQDLPEAWHLRRLGSADPAARVDSARALVRLGSAAGVRRLLEIPSLEPPSCLGRELNVELVAACGAGAMPILLAALERDEDRVKLRALAALRELRPPAAAPALVRALADPADQIRQAAGNTLAALDPAAGGVLFALETALADGDPRVRMGAARALGDMGPPARAAIPALTRVLDDEDSLVRIHAAWSLGDLGPDRTALPALIAALADGVENVRRAAARALSMMGPEARDAVAALTTALADGNNEVRQYAAAALERIGSPR